MKLFRNTFYALLMACALVSCDAIAEKHEIIDEPSSDPISPSQQKKKIQDSCRDAIAMVDPDNFRELIELISFFSDEYSSYDIDEEYTDKVESLGSWSDTKAAVNEALSVLSTSLVRPMSTPEISYFTLNAGISDLYGKFTCSESREMFVYEPSNDGIILEFPDQNGKQCTVSLKASGKESTFSIKVTDDYDGRYSSYRDEADITVKVPKFIELKITRGSSVLATMTLALSLDGSLKIDLQESEDNYGYQVDDLGVAISSSLLSVSLTTKVGDYKAVQEIAVTKSEISAGVSLSSGSRSIVNLDASLTGSFGKKIRIEGSDDNVPDYIEEYLDSFNATVSVLDNLQLHAECKDAGKMARAIEFADEVDNTSKSQMKEAAAKLNDAFAITLHFDNDSHWQCKGLIMIDSERDDWDGKTYYYAVPALLFSDDTTYLFEEFFDSSDFERLVEDFEDMVESFEDIVR